MKVIGTRRPAGRGRIASSGSNAPVLKEIAEAMAGCHGFVSASGSKPSSAST